MKFSEMKLEVTNAVRAYFNRNWTMADLMNSGEIPENAYPSLIKVYLTLFCAMSSFNFGYFFHLTWQVGGLFTVLSSMASLLCLHFTSPMRVMMRVSILMYAAYNLGACFGPYMDYFFKMHQKKNSLLALQACFGLLVVATLGIGAVCFMSLLTRERSEIYKGCLLKSWALIFCTFVASNSDLIDSATTHYMLKVCIVVPLFLGYIVVYSQEILYDAQFGEIDFFNRTINIFDLPAIVVHSVRVPFLGAEIEQHRQN